MTKQNKYSIVFLGFIHLDLIVIFLFCSFFVSCASFRQSGYRTVQDGEPIITPVDTNVIGYGPLRIISAPTEDTPTLKVYLPKQVIIKLKYETRIHKEEVLVKQPTRFEKNVYNLASTIGLTALGTLGTDNLPGRVIVVSVGSLISAYYLIASPRPEEETKYVPLLGTNSLQVKYGEETKTIEAGHEPLTINNKAFAVTNNMGIATFEIRNITDFDDGVVINHMNSTDKYLVRRIPQERLIEKDWVSAAKKLELGIEAADLIKFLVKRAPRTINPNVILSEIVAGVVIHVLIETLGTYREQYYDWVIISVN